MSSVGDNDDDSSSAADTVPVRRRRPRRDSLGASSYRNKENNDDDNDDTGGRCWRLLVWLKQRAASSTRSSRVKGQVDVTSWVNNRLSDFLSDKTMLSSIGFNNLTDFDRNELWVDYILPAETNIASARAIVNAKLSNPPWSFEEAATVRIINPMNRGTVMTVTRPVIRRRYVRLFDQHPMTVAIKMLGICFVLALALYAFYLVSFQLTRVSRGSDNPFSPGNFD